MAGKGRPNIIPTEDIPKIIVDINNGKKKSVIAKQYGVSQASIDGLIKRYQQKHNIQPNDLPKLNNEVDALVNSVLEFQVNLNRLKDKYSDELVSFYYQLTMKQKLLMGGYAEAVDTFKHKVNEVLKKDKVLVKVGFGEGVERYIEKDIDLADSTHYVNISKALMQMATLEGIYMPQTTPTVAIQNNNNNEAKVESLTYTKTQDEKAQKLLASVIPQDE